MHGWFLLFWKTTILNFDNIILFDIATTENTVNATDACNYVSSIENTYNYICVIVISRFYNNFNIQWNINIYSINVYLFEGVKRWLAL